MEDSFGQVNELLPQKEFRHRWVLFAGKGNLDHEIAKQIVAASAVIHALYLTVVVKKELKMKLLIYQQIQPLPRQEELRPLEGARTSENPVEVVWTSD